MKRSMRAITILAPMLALALGACEAEPERNPVDGPVTTQPDQPQPRQQRDEVKSENEQVSMANPLTGKQGGDVLDNTALTEEQKEVVRTKTLAAVTAVGKCVQDKSAACQQRAEAARADLEATIRSFT